MSFPKIVNFVKQNNNKDLIKTAIQLAMGITGITNALSNFIFTTLSHDPGAADTISRYMEPRAEDDMVPWHLIYDTPDWLAYGKLALYGLFWAAVIISVIVCIRLLTKHFSASVRDAILKRDS